MIKLQARDFVRISSDRDDITSYVNVNNLVAQHSLQETPRKKVTEPQSNLHNKNRTNHEERILQIDELDEWWTHVKEKPRIHDEPKRLYPELKDETNQLKIGDQVLLDEKDPRITTTKMARLLLRYSMSFHTVQSKIAGGNIGRSTKKVRCKPKEPLDPDDLIVDAKGMTVNSSGSTNEPWKDKLIGQETDPAVEEDKSPKQETVLQEEVEAKKYGSWMTFERKAKEEGKNSGDEGGWHRGGQHSEWF
ncbi:hypothetical protein GOBAR_AA38824 [Gossypium barbadense]|uniref:Uncharacterized protein n=1 Tax=Gossypium barbadense TaxID=3634 RepID=A0A2P5VSS9_GOSBA|nr:hypothetical protein GOBAR_AA38824 [Gossypium barbadense]